MVLIRLSGIFFICLVLTSCNDNKQKAEEKNRIIRNEFDSMNKKLDSMNMKIEKGLDSAIHNIDSLLLELDKKNKK